MKLVQYLKNRWAEPSTKAGLATAVVSAAVVLFPEYALAISTVAGVLGIGVAATPTKGV